MAIPTGPRRKANNSGKISGTSSSDTAHHHATTTTTATQNSEPQEPQHHNNDNDDNNNYPSTTDPSYQSFENSQDVVWRVRPDDTVYGDPYSMNQTYRRDKALDIFRRNQPLPGSNDRKIDSQTRKTRVGCIDDRRVEFELVTNVNQSPEESFAQRAKFHIRNIRYEQMTLEERIRLYMCQWNIAQLCLLYVSLFMLLNVLFAGFFSALEENCCGDATLGYNENFQFTIQTWTTIGYGTLSPVGDTASFWVVVNSILSLIVNTIFAGLLFLRIVRPSANLQFSKVVTYCNVHGLPCLEIRVGNPENFNLLIDVVGTLQMVWEGLEDSCDYSNYANEVRMYGDDAEHAATTNKNEETSFPNTPTTVVITKDLKLLQDSYYTIPSVRTFRHVVDESSPLFGLRLDEFTKMFYLNFRIQATNSTTQSQISASTMYDQHDVLVGHRFRPQVHLNHQKSTLTCDFSKMNETHPFPVWYAKPKTFSSRRTKPPEFQQQQHPNHENVQI